MAVVLPATTRGVVEIELGGRAYRLTPSWQALDEIETQLQTGIGVLCGKAMAGSMALSFNEIAVILTAGIKATGEAEQSHDRGVTLTAVKELLHAQGVYSLNVEVSAFILATVAGGKLVEPDAAPGKDAAEDEAAASQSADTSASPAAS